MITVALGSLLRQDIARLCANTPGVETGGLILNGRHGLLPTGPGPLAVCTRYALEWDTSYVLGCIETAQALGCEVLGRWHAHPSPVLLASERDRESAEQFRQAIGAEEIIDVIVACEAGKTIGWAAYVCSEGGHERAEIELPNACVPSRGALEPL